MNNDPLANAMSKILNYERLGRQNVQLYPSNKMAKAILTILNSHGFVGTAEERKTTRGSELTLPLIGKINAIGVIKPRYAVKKEEFEKFEKRYLPAKGFGVIVISTSKGVMTLDDAKKQNVGGRLVAFCY